MGRVEIAYSIILVLAVGLAACGLYLRHHSHERVYRRGLERERAQNAQRMAARARKDGLEP